MSGESAIHSIRRAIVTGTAPPGSWMREQEWAQRLGLSRTPIREAFVELEGEGLLRRELNRGFQCTELSVAELEMLYPVIIAMEELALRGEALRTRDLAETLAQRNDELSDPNHTPLQRVALDQAWHHALVSAAGNDAATQVHRRISDRIARYEHVYWQESSCAEESFDEHDRIVAALRDDDRELAVALIRAHWRRALRRLKERYSPAASGRRSTPS